MRYLTFSLFLGCVAGSAQDFAGKAVVSVRFEPERQPVDARDLQNMQLIEVGRPLDVNQVGTTIDRLYASGLFDDIQVDAEPSAGGVALRFITKARRFVGHVGAEGDIKDPPNRSVIIANAQMILGSRYDPETLKTAERTILQELRKNGLFEARVTSTTIEDQETHQVTIQFLINAGTRARYTTPEIHGDTKLATGTIIRATGWRVPLIHRWRKVTQALTDKGTEGIQKRFAKADRLTATVNLTSLDYDPDTHRAKPTLDIDAGPKIEIKAVEAKVSKGKLRRYIPVYEEGSVDNDLLAEGARNLHDYFQSKGYPDVDVTFKREPQREDQQLINYYIASGPRRKLVSVILSGDNYFDEETIRERMFLRPNSLVLRYGRYSEVFRQNDEQAIESLYRGNGFRDVKVTSEVQTDYNGKANQLGVTFRIYPGKQWTVAEVDIKGANRLDLTPIRTKLVSAVGQPFADLNIASDRSLILDYYYSNGFPSATFRYSTSPGEQPQTEKIEYQIVEGPRQFVRKVIVSGLYRTKARLVEKRIDIHEGEPISMTKVNDIARQLTDLGIFANVSTGLQDANGSNRYKYVLYDVDEAARYTFNVGLGLEVGQFGRTTNNLSAAGGIKGFAPIVSFDVSRLNFLGRGETLSLQTRYSSIEQRESLNYVIPRFLGSANRTLTTSLLYNTTQDVQTFSSRRAEAAVQVSQRFNRASTLLARFAYRRVSTGNIQIPSLLIPALLQPVRIGILSASYIQDHRDNSADAHRGFWNTVDAGVTGPFFGSQRSFVRVLARNATYTPIAGKFTFARQTQLGMIKPFNVPAGSFDFEAIPLPERFFGGGGVSMRGFGDNQAGPRDIGTANQLPGPISSTPTGFPIGGNALLFNTLEFRFPLLGPNISGVFFHDMGNIYTNFSKLSFNYKQKSDQDLNYAVQAAGFGIRYKTPLGPVRVDLAYTFNPARYQGFSRNETITDLLPCTPEVIAIRPGQPGYNPNCQSSGQQLGHFQFFFSIGQAF
jgi:outer membrane protein insertion porin family